MSGTILLIDDDERLLSVLARTLRAEGFGVRTANAAEIALSDLALRPCDLAVVDLMMPGMSGLEFLQVMGKKYPRIPVIVMSGMGSIDVAVQAMQGGAADFVEKPIRPERIQTSIHKALEMAALQDRHERLLEDIGANKRLVGSSTPMRQLRQLIVKVARTDARVLVLGENGTGKELIASAIHEGSARAEQPFIKLNCSALPDHLLESELFGHERGAFTGAHARRRGRFELAHRGTLFLDEIGDMPLSMQAKILRALQEGEFERVGGAETISVDVRVIAATNKDIESMVDLGSFREDLFYRLNVFTLRPAPLRDRPGDVPELVEHLLKINGNGLQFTIGALRALEQYPFPGNVRELQNIVERLVILADGPRIDEGTVRASLPRLRSHAPTPQTQIRNVAPPFPTSRIASLEEFERERVLRALHESSGKRGDAARLLGMSRSTLWRRLKALGLE